MPNFITTFLFFYIVFKVIYPDTRIILFIDSQMIITNITHIVWWSKGVEFI